MQTQLIDGVPALPDDQRIARLIEDEADPFGGGPHEYRIGIEGPDGRLYRTITAHGLGEFVRVDSELQGFGLIKRPTRPGFDEVYGR